MLAGLVGRAKERQPVLVEACWRGRSRMVGVGGWGCLLGVGGEDAYLATQNPGY